MSLLLLCLISASILHLSFAGPSASVSNGSISTRGSMEMLEVMEDLSFRNIGDEDHMDHKTPRYRNVRDNKQYTTYEPLPEELTFHIGSTDSKVSNETSPVTPAVFREMDPFVFKMVCQWLDKLDKFGGDKTDKLSDTPSFVSHLEWAFAQKLMNFTRLSSKQEMLRSESFYSTIWSILTEEQQIWVQYAVHQQLTIRQEGNEGIINRDVMMGFVADAFFAINISLIEALGTKQFLLAVLPELDDPKNVVFAVLRDITNEVFTREKAVNVLKRLKDYILWVHQQENNGDLRHVRAEAINQKIQSMLYHDQYRNGIADVFPNEFRDFLIWWFKLSKLRFKFHHKCNDCRVAMNRYQYLNLPHYRMHRALRRVRLHSL